METVALGLKRLRRVGALGVAGGVSLVVLQLGPTLSTLAWLLGALTGAELAARGGARLAGEDASHALWLSPVSAVLVAATGAVGLLIAGEPHSAAGLCIWGGPVAMLWGTLLGALSAWCET
jgi:hypothetical protein